MSLHGDMKSGRVELFLKIIQQNKKLERYFACRQMATSAAEERLGRCSALAARYVAGINHAGWMEREVRTLLAAQKPEGVRGCLVRQALHH
jgi:hypothetical protein